MNDLEINVLSGDNASPPSPNSRDQLLPQKYPEGSAPERESPELRKIYERAHQIAYVLGHCAVEIAHLLLAFSVMSDGKARLLERGHNPEHVRRNCWFELEVLEHQPNGAQHIALSADVELVRAMASTEALKNDVSARSVQVRQVLDALLDERLSEKVGRLLSEVPKPASLEEIRSSVEAGRHTAENEFRAQIERAELSDARLAKVEAEAAQSNASLAAIGGKIERIEKKVRQSKVAAIIAALLPAIGLVAALVYLFWSRAA